MANQFKVWVTYDGPDPHPCKCWEPSDLFIREFKPAPVTMLQRLGLKKCSNAQWYSLKCIHCGTELRDAVLQFSWPKQTVLEILPRLARSDLEEIAVDLDKELKKK